jgi:Cu-Zn family superoxide dismutase
MTRLNRTLAAAVTLSVAVGLSAGCNNMPWNKKNDSRSTTRSPSQSNASMKTAVARIRPSSGASTQPANTNVNGTVTFTQMPDGVRVAVNVTGLAPNTTHGFHIHEKGDLTDPNLVSAGAHFNPEGHKHGGPQSAMAHAGDLGNITSDANGNVNTEMTVRGLMLDTGKMGIVGRSVLVHAKEDDLKTDPSGNSGGRIAGGVIEMQK